MDEELLQSVQDAADEQEMRDPPKKPLPANFVKEIDKARKERQTEVFLWNITLRFLAGEQNIDFDWERKQFVGASSKPGKNQIIENQLRPIWNALANALSVEYPSVAVSPASPSQDDITKALASEQLGRYHWNVNQMQYKYRDLSEWMLAGGTSGFHTYWVEEDQKLTTEVVKCFDLLAEAGATSDEEASWNACRKTYKRSVLLKIPEYKKFRKVIENAPSNSQESMEGNRNRLSSPQPTDRIDLWDVYFDDGRHGILCNDTWLFEGSYNPKSEKPLILVRYNKIPGRFWGQSVMALLLDLQRQLNHVNNLILDLMDSNSNLIWLVPFGAGVNIRNLNNAPDGVVGYTGGAGEPQRLPAPAIPPHLFEIRRQIIQAMMDVAGVHSTTLGKRAVGITSKVAIEAMVNQDASQLQGTMDDIERATHTLMTTVLSMYKRKLTAPLAMRMLDKSIGRVIYQELEATTLSEQPELEIAVGSLFRTELQDRNQQILDMLEKQMLTPDQAKKMLTLHVSNQDAMQKMVAYNRATMMLEAAKSGAPITINRYVDDLDAIKEVFSEYVHSPEYYEEAILLKHKYDQTGDMALAEPHDKAVAKMDYIYDILVAVSTPPDATPDQLANITQSQIFPRATPNADQAAATALAASSPETSAQSAEDSAQLAQRKALIQNVDQAADQQPIVPGGVGA